MVSFIVLTAWIANIFLAAMACVFAGQRSVRGGLTWLGLFGGITRCSCLPLVYEAPNGLVDILKFDLATPDEMAFVYDSWARSFQKSPFAGVIPNHLYPQVSRAASAEIIDRGAKVLVAYAELPEGGRRVMGYSVSEPEKQVLHWLFVKHDYRKLGVARALLDKTCSGWQSPSYTYRTKASSQFLGPSFRWDPKHARVKA